MFRTLTSIVQQWTEDGRAFRMLNILDECSRECLSIRVRRKLSSVDIIDLLPSPMPMILMCYAPECVAEAARKWIGVVGAKTAYIEPGSPGRMDISRPSMRGSETSS